VTQQLDRPVPGTFLGKGKIEELRDRIVAENASLVIFDEELSPAQAKNLEEATGTRVVDRAELILDIFAIRARSREAKLQVELAQLEYMLPRLTRMWTHLEKFRGGIGVRGPGETQLETDRRLINKRIKTIRERLDEVQRSREVQRHSRKGEFRAALVGYTNAGKSSILRALSGAMDVHVEDRLFATLDPLTREVDLGEHGKVLLTDTVGFIRKLPHHLVASFRATLEEAGEADILLHVIDASHPAWEEQRVVVQGVLAELGLQTQPILNVFNKVDALSAEQLATLQDRVVPLAPLSVFVSALSEAEMEPLRRALSRAVGDRRALSEVRIPLGDGAILSEVHRGGEVLEQRVDGDDLVLRVRLEADVAARLERGGASVSVVKG
jgi:GTP-binding protein HflX